MTRYTWIYTISLLTMSACSFSQDVTIVVEDGSSKDLQLFSIIGKDTTKTQLMRIDSMTFHASVNSANESILIKYREKTFDIGKLDEQAKRILFSFNEKAGDGCYAVTKVYGDVAKTKSPQPNGTCNGITNISILDVDITNTPVKIRKRVE